MTREISLSSTTTTYLFSKKMAIPHSHFCATPHIYIQDKDKHRQLIRLVPKSRVSCIQHKITIYECCTHGYYTVDNLLQVLWKFPQIVEAVT